MLSQYPASIHASRWSDLTYSAIFAVVTIPNSIPSARKHSDDWFRNWFDEDYLALYQHRDSTEARLFLDNVRERFQHLGSQGVFDLACGAGRHSWVLATEFDWPVVGLDLSLSLLNEAIKHEPIPAKGRPIFVRGDLRQLPFQDTSCHLVLSAFTSFGYFSDNSEHQTTLNEMGRVLCAGGVLILDLMNPSVAIENLVPEDETSRNNWRVKQSRRYVSESKRIEKTIELIARNGETRVVQESVRLFTPDELTAMLQAAGMKLIDRWGEYDASPFDPTRSKRMISIAERT
jgi:ubiquinone/menaquinone biosynthesis C-methylase UbiE